MKRYLQITYRQGKPLAAYLYLNRQSGDKADRIERHGQWLIDYTKDGRAIGIDFTQVGAVDLAALNRILTASHQAALSVNDLVPLEAA
jgi:uncharacterized protein YuzE